MTRSGGPVRWRFGVLKMAVLSLLLGFVTTITVSWGAAWLVDPTGGDLRQGVRRRADAAHEVLPATLREGYLTVTYRKATRYQHRFAMLTETLWWRWCEPDRTEWRRFDPAGPEIAPELAPGWAEDGAAPAELHEQWLRTGPIPVGQLRSTLATGFPCPAFAAEVEHVLLLPPNMSLGYAQPSRSWQQRPLPRRGAMLGQLPPWRGFYPRAIPTYPIWRGLLIDTLIYASLSLTLLVVAIPVRRQWRTWRGRCPMCNYNLRADFDAGCPECGWRRASEGKPVRTKKGMGTSVPMPRRARG